MTDLIQTVMVPKVPPWTVKGLVQYLGCPGVLPACVSPHDFMGFRLTRGDAIIVLEGLFHRGVGQLRRLYYHKACDEGRDCPPFASTPWNERPLDLPTVCTCCETPIFNREDISVDIALKWSRPFKLEFYTPQLEDYDRLTLGDPQSTLAVEHLPDKQLRVMVWHPEVLMPDGSRDLSAWLTLSPVQRELLCKWLEKHRT